MSFTEKKKLCGFRCHVQEHVTLRCVFQKQLVWEVEGREKPVHYLPTAAVSPLRAENLSTCRLSKERNS